MSENKKNVINEVERIEDLNNWISSIQWDSKSNLYNKINQEQYAKFISNTFEKIKISKEDTFSALDCIFKATTYETKYVVYFILCLSNMYKYSAYIRDFLMTYTSNYIDSLLVEELKVLVKPILSSTINKYIKLISQQLMERNANIALHDMGLMCFSILTLVNNSINKMYKDKSMLAIERKIVEFFCGKSKDLDIKVDLYLPSELMGQPIKDETFEKNLIKYSYLYDGLTERVESLEAINQNLLLDKSNLNEKTITLRNKVHELEETIKVKEEQVQNISFELNQALEDRNKAESRLGFERNKYEQGFLSMQSNLLDSLKSDLQLEIEGIQDIIEFLSEEKRAKIQRRLKRIEKIIDERLGE